MRDALSRERNAEEQTELSGLFPQTEVRTGKEQECRPHAGNLKVEIPLPGHREEQIQGTGRPQEHDGEPKEVHDRSRNTRNECALPKREI